MWKDGFDVKKLVSGYLSSVMLANEENESDTPKWPSWEMNNHEQLVEGKFKLFPICIEGLGMM